MQELLGVLSIASALLVLLMIWVTARPVRRHAPQAAARPAEERVAWTPPARRETEARGSQEAGTELVTAQKEAAEEKKEEVTTHQAAGEGEVQEQRAEEQEVAEETGRRETGSSGEEAEDELVRQLSETLSLYRQLLEELNRLRSGGSK